MRLKVEFVDLLLIGVVIHGRDGEREVPNRLGVYAVNLNGQHLVARFDTRFDLALYVVRGRAVSLAVYLPGVRAQAVRAAVGKANALDVGECERIRRAEMLFHFRIDYVRIELVCRAPHSDYFLDFRRHLAHVHVLDCLLLAPRFERGNVVGYSRFEQAVFSVPGDIALVVQEHFHVGAEQVFIFLARLVGEHKLGIRIERVRPIGFELLRKQLDSLVVVVGKVRVRVALLALFELGSELLYRKVDVLVFVDDVERHLG